MQSSELQQFLYEQIPITKALNVHVVSATASKVVLRCLLMPNRNHMQTAFGGSLAAVLILACYSWLFNILQERGYRVHIILKSAQTDYLAPVDEDFVATCSAPEEKEFENLMNAFDRKGLARVHLFSQIEANGKRLCSLAGEFVVKKVNDYSAI